MRDLTGATTVVGVIGHPVAHSLSPLMHNRAFAHVGLDWVYVPFEVREDALGSAMAGLKALSVRGVNVTIPHKTAVIPLMDRLAPAAVAIGAVNTIINRHGVLVGDNTDGIGFIRSLTDEAGFDPTGARVVVLGAGGAARAIAVELARHGAEHVAIANRTEARARELAEVVAEHGAASTALSLESERLGPLLKSSDLLVQTTPLGLTGNTPSRPDAAPGGESTSAPAATSTSAPAATSTSAPAATSTSARAATPTSVPAGARTPTVDAVLPVDADLLRPPLLVADIVYTPVETPLLVAAGENGCPVLPGWGMLLYQGVEAFERWTDTAAPVDVMRDALLEALRGASS